MHGMSTNSGRAIPYFFFALNVYFIVPSDLAGSIR